MVTAIQVDNLYLLCCLPYFRVKMAFHTIPVVHQKLQWKSSVYRGHSKHALRLHGQAGPYPLLRPHPRCMCITITFNLAHCLSLCMHHCFERAWGFSYTVHVLWKKSLICGLWRECCSCSFANRIESSMINSPANYNSQAPPTSRHATPTSHYRAALGGAVP